MKLELSAVKKSYGGRVVLDICSLTFEESVSYAIIGPNGSGKTTLLRLLAGIETADSGQITYNGKTSLCRKNIAYLPQNPYVFDMTVYENIASGIRGDKDCHEITTAAISRAGLVSVAQSRAKALSGGEAQKTSVLRTLVLNRELILLDEPATFIDISNMERIEDSIKTMKQNKSTVIFSTHNPSQAMRLAEEVLVLMDGRIVEAGPSQNILNSPSSTQTREFLNNWRYTGSMI